MKRQRFISDEEAFRRVNRVKECPPISDEECARRVNRITPESPISDAEWEERILRAQPEKLPDDAALEQQIFYETQPTLNDLEVERRVNNFQLKDNYMQKVDRSCGAFFLDPRYTARIAAHQDDLLHLTVDFCHFLGEQGYHNAVRTIYYYVQHSAFFRQCLANFKLRNKGDEPKGI